MMPPTVSRSIPSEESTRHFDPILQPDLARLYPARAARLQALAGDHPLHDYMTFAASVAACQGALLTRVQPGAVTPAGAAQETGWISLLHVLTEGLREDAPANVITLLDSIDAMSADDLHRAGAALAEGDFDAVDPAIAPILWAALSEQLAVSVRAVPLPTHGETPGGCPVCGTAPVASLIYGGLKRGLRYLHCALCESEWHHVRALCSNCGSTHDVEYLSLDTVEAVVQAECCDHCHSYLKIVSQEREATAEAIADDLGTLTLDDAVTAEGYRRTGFNPWALPEVIPA